MAYPSVTSPYGLLPINLIGGQVFAGSTRQIPIATNSSTARRASSSVHCSGGDFMK